MKKLCFILIFGFITAQVSWGQEDTGKVQAWQDSLQKYYKKDTRKFLVFAQKLKEYYRTQKDIKNLIILQNKITSQYTITGKLPEAVQSIDKAIKWSGEIKNDSLMGFSYITKAAIYFYQKDYLTSIKYFSKADSLTRNKMNKTNILRNYAFIKKDLGDYLGAIQIYKKIYYSFQNAEGYERLRFINLLDIINAYLDYTYRYNDHPEFNDSIQKYTRIALAFNDDSSYVKDLLHLTMLRVELNQHPERGERIFKKMDSIQQNLWKLDIHYVDPAIYFDKAKISYNLKKYKKALFLLNKIKKSKASSGFQLSYKDQIDALYAKVYRKLGMTRKALDKTMALNQMLQQKEQQRIMVDKVLRDQYDYQTINRRMRELEERIVKESHTNTYLIAGLLLIGFFSAWVIYRRKTQEKNYLTVIEEMNQKISELDSKKRSTKGRRRSRHLPPEKIYNEILAKLQDFEKSYLYLDPYIDLNYMVDYVGYNKSYVSAVINDFYRVNLKDFLNRLRIKYAVERMRNSDVLYNYNIYGMAQDFGFKTSKTFTNAFKKFTGIYPSEFIKQAKNDNFD